MFKAAEISIMQMDVVVSTETKKKGTGSETDRNPSHVQ
jgi:hypothetical protein